MEPLPLIGVDITSVPRIEALLQRRPRFAARVFTPDERSRCADHPERFATRWAAKEAVRKLAGAAGVALPAFADIEVVAANRAHPEAPAAHVRTWSEPVSLSLSHDGDLAIAVAAAADIPLATEAVSEIVLAERGAGAHKGTFGRVTLAVGSRGYSGAACLAAMGAARGGAGLVHLLVPESIYTVVAAQCTEVIVTPVPDEDGGFGGALWHWIDDNPRGHSLVIGCGLGKTPGAQRALVEVLSRFAMPMVVDADGLNLAATRQVDWRRRPGPTVLTPHPAEMGRLTGLDVAAVQADRERVAREFAERHAVVVVLKGAHTVIAAPDGRYHVDAHDVVALATAGTGDVLAGVAGAMLAQGLDAYDAAVAAVTIHAEAGMAMQRIQGRAGTVASDIVSALPRAQERIRRALEARA